MYAVGLLKADVFAILTANDLISVVNDGVTFIANFE